MSFEILFALSGLIVVVTTIYAAIMIRRRLRELGAIIASQARKRENGESGNAYNADVDRDPQ